MRRAASSRAKKRSGSALINLVQSLPKYNASTAFDTSKNIIKNLETFVGKNTSFDDIAIIAIKREY